MSMTLHLYLESQVDLVVSTGLGQTQGGTHTIKLVSIWKLIHSLSVHGIHLYVGNGAIKI